MTHAAEHTVDIDGLPQRYHVAGSGPVCVAHSGGPGVGWEYLRMPLLEEFLTMVYIEPVGTGNSGTLPEHPHGYTLDRYVTHIDRVVEDIGERAVIFLGHSYAGLIGHQYAWTHPAKLKGLILYSTIATDGVDYHSEVERNFQKFLRRHSAEPDLDTVRNAYQKIYQGNRDADDDDALTTNFRQVVPVYFADYWRREAEFSALRENARRWQVLDDRRPYDHRGRLSSITAPTLVVTGRYDVVCPPRWSEEIHGEIKESTLTILEGSGHFAHLEEPREFARTVRDFVDRRLPNT